MNASTQFNPAPPTLQPATTQPDHLPTDGWGPGNHNMPAFAAALNQLRDELALAPAAPAAHTHRCDGCGGTGRITSCIGGSYPCYCTMPDTSKAAQVARLESLAADALARAQDLRMGIEDLNDGQGWDLSHSQVDELVGVALAWADGIGAA